jgi:ActR/RegA family two-component response regulator
MKFQALLVLADNQASEVLSRVLDDYQVESEHCADRESALRRLEDKHFDAVVVDFDDAGAANQILQDVRQSSTSKSAVAIGLWSDRENVRTAFGIGANFILYKPVSGDQACATLRSAVSLLKRERRRSFRVPVQLPLTISWNGAPEVEGIMLDLSEDGMDVLSAQPLGESQVAEFHFSLPGLSDLKILGQIAWANSNGQAGVQFVDLTDAQRGTLSDWLAHNAPETPPPDPEPLTQCKLTDLSLGGCYIETESPFPQLTKIELWLKAGQQELHVRGIVRVMHPGRGMGVEFASSAPDDRGRVEGFIDLLSSHSDVMPQLLVAPKSISFHGEPSKPAPEAQGDELLQLLHSPEHLTENAFLAELRRQRRSETETTAV